MQFRLMRNRIQLLRSVYDQSLKRCKQVLIGSIPCDGNEPVSSELLAKLTDAEKTALDAYMIDYRRAEDLRVQAVAIEQAPNQINLIADAVKASNQINGAQANSIFSAVGRLTMAIEEKGFFDKGGDDGSNR